MDFWSWIGIAGGIALAGHELWPALRAWRNRDREWWSRICWGTVGLVVAVAALITGVASAAASAEAAKQAKLEAAHTISTQQYDSLIPALRRINAGKDKLLRVRVAAAELPRGPYQFAMLLLYVLEEGGVGMPSNVESAPAPEPGLTLYVSEETSLTRDLVSALGVFDHKVRVVTKPAPEPLLEWVGIDPPEQRVALLVGRLVE